MCDDVMCMRRRLSDRNVTFKKNMLDIKNLDQNADSPTKLDVFTQQWLHSHYFEHWD